jgi:hypothetical protein
VKIGKIMGQNRAIIRVVIFLFITVLVLFMGFGNMISHASAGPKTIAGRVYTSQGEHLGEGHEGSYIAVVVEHDGEKSTYIGSNGLELDDSGDYWYVVVIPDGEWEEDDTFWIRVDGTGWGDLNYTCVAHGNPDVNCFKMDATGTEGQDVDTVLTKRADDDGSPGLIFLLFVVIIAAIVVIVTGVALAYNLKPKKPV